MAGGGNENTSSEIDFLTKCQIGGVLAYATGNALLETASYELNRMLGRPQLMHRSEVIEKARRMIAEQAYMTLNPEKSRTDINIRHTYYAVEGGEVKIKCCGCGQCIPAEGVDHFNCDCSQAKGIWFYTPEAILADIGQGLKDRQRQLPATLNEHIQQLGKIRDTDILQFPDKSQMPGKEDIYAVYLPRQRKATGRVLRFRYQPEIVEYAGQSYSTYVTVEPIAIRTADSWVSFSRYGDEQWSIDYLKILFYTREELYDFLEKNQSDILRKSLFTKEELLARNVPSEVLDRFDWKPLPPLKVQYPVTIE